MARRCLVFVRPNKSPKLREDQATLSFFLQHRMLNPWERAWEHGTRILIAS